VEPAAQQVALLPVEFQAVELHDGLVRSAGRRHAQPRQHEQPPPQRGDAQAADPHVGAAEALLDGALHQPPDRGGVRDPRHQHQEQHEQGDEGDGETNPDADRPPKAAAARFLALSGLLRRLRHVLAPAREGSDGTHVKA